jgi:hypothetical protein
MSLLGDLQLAVLERDMGRAVNRLLEYYRENGESFQMTVYSIRKTIEFQITLKDVAAPVIITLRGYSLADDSGRPELLFARIETPWNWIDSALTAFHVAERRVPIPPEFADYLRLILHA